MKFSLVMVIAVFLTGCEWEWQWDYERDSAPLPSPTVMAVATPTPSPQEVTDTLPLEIEVEELRSVIRTLAEENRRLRDMLADAREETAPATSTFAVVPESTPTPQASFEIAPSSDVSTQEVDLPTVLYVNPNWHYLVINQGSEDGFVNQEQIDIFREGAKIATATVTEVKPGQAVAEVNLDSMGSAGLYPRKTDKVRKQ